MSIPRKRRSTVKLTIADVAQHAGEGTKTVSRTLRTPEQDYDQLREKIEPAVHELGYIHKLAARALAYASAHTIAKVVPNHA
ncbi:LacI family DNA-binding transcriptional regulator, partial [Salmonella enterica]|uniref:LacI family DNA-binding transcriptional regulator n=1 Tax=Salmonella enterica TaxID=28901 RepID=UPI003F4B1898